MILIWISEKKRVFRAWSCDEGICLPESWRTVPRCHGNKRINDIPPIRPPSDVGNLGIVKDAFREILLFSQATLNKASIMVTITSNDLQANLRNQYNWFFYQTLNKATLSYLKKVKERIPQEFQINHLILLKMIFFLHRRFLSLVRYTFIDNKMIFLQPFDNDSFIVCIDEYGKFKL